jgi:hypothetical protein
MVTNGISLQLDAEVLRPVIEQVVAETLARLEQVRATLPDRLAYGEPEAAALLSLAAHQLRDERLRGRIAASIGPGGRILYSRSALVAYLASRPWTPASVRGNGKDTKG